MCSNRLTDGNYVAALRVSDTRATLTHQAQSAMLQTAYPVIASVITLLVTLNQQSHAQQLWGDSLEVNGTSTLHQDVTLEGVVSFGKLQTSSSSVLEPGFRVKVEQEISTTEHEDITPGHYENQTIFVDDYGWLSQATSRWVEDYGFYTTDVWVDEWGYVYPSIWTDATYDIEGNEIAPGGWSTSTTPEWGIVGGHMQQQSVWGIVGGHMESVGTDEWGIVGSHQEVQNVWVDEVRSSYTETTFGVPHTKFISDAENMAWSWYNNGRELLEVTNAGLSIPYPGDPIGNNRAILTSTQFEQSYTTSSAEVGNYTSYGTKQTKEGITAWRDYGLEQAVTDSNSAHLRPHELVIETKAPSTDGVTVSTVGTRISATDASFGGTVRITGAILINPQGDLSMGIYTNGPKP